MKILINKNFKALRVGKFVTASEDAGEFIFDSKLEDQWPVATILEIGKANGISLKKGKKSEVIEILINHIKTLELPQMNEKTDSQKVKEIVEDGIKSGKSDDDMLIEIVQSGIKFKAAGRMFKEAMETGGYRITAKVRKEQCREMLVNEEFTPKNYEQVQEMMEKLSNEINDTTTSQAYSAIKSYAKEFEIELPKPDKKSTGGLRSKVFSWIVSNPTSTKEDMKAFITEQGDYTAERVEKYVRSYTPTLEVANQIATN